MHPRLRRELGADGQPLDSARFIESVQALCREYEGEKERLEESIAALAIRLRRARRGAEAARERSAGRQVLRERRAQLTAEALQRSDVACVRTDGGLLVRDCNPAAAALCGTASAKGRSLFALLKPVDPEALTLSWPARLGRGEPLVQTLRCATADQRALTCDWICLPRLGRDGKLASVTVLWREQRPAARPAAPSAARNQGLSLVLSLAGEALVEWDLLIDRLSLSPEGRELLGLDASAALRGEDWFARVHPDDIAPLRADFAAHLQQRSPRLEHDQRVRTREGEWRWISLRGAAVRNEKQEPVRFVGLAGDITRHRAQIERMAHDARHDALTGLANRTLFLDLLRHSFNRIRRHESYRFAVLFIDIDRFKEVNDALGHEAGDELLVQIARRLETSLRQGDTLARHGGDEFTMWLDDVHNDQDALRAAARIHETMRAPFRLGTEVVNSSASIGIALGSSRSLRAEDVLRDADVAMYRAKAAGRARTEVFAPGSASKPKALPIEADLRSEDLLNQLRVHYLPIVEVATGRVRGLEALARWQHPRLGLVSPERFLDIAVETGLIVGIDQWVIRTASRQLQRWRRDLGHLSELTISVNLSDKVLGNRELPAQIDEILREAQLLPRDLICDIGEGAMAASSSAAWTLSSLHQRGIRLHADDFGVGTSWLRHLHSIEVDSIKIDRSFLAGKGAEDRRVMGHLVALARDLGKSVIAEGVETDQQLSFLREVGCQSAQGYLFSNPVDAEKTLSLLASGFRAPSA